MKIGFNLTNYEDFVKHAMELNEQLRRESEEYSAILKQEVVVPEKMKDLGSCTFPCNVRR